MVGNTRLDGEKVPLIVLMNIDCIDSPADVNPKGTSATAEGKKRTSVAAEEHYGYCILSEPLDFPLGSESYLL